MGAYTNLIWFVILTQHWPRDIPYPNLYRPHMWIETNTRVEYV